MIILWFKFSLFLKINRLKIYSSLKKITHKFLFHFRWKLWLLYRPWRASLILGKKIWKTNLKDFFQWWCIVHLIYNDHNTKLCLIMSFAPIWELFPNLYYLPYRTIFNNVSISDSTNQHLHLSPLLWGN